MTRLVRRGIRSRALLLGVGVCLLSGCVKPSVFQVNLAAPLSRPSIGNYQEAVEAIVAVLKDELGIPFPRRVTLYLYPQQLAFQRGLEEEVGFAPVSAARTADYASAVATTGKVLVNEMDVARAPWNRTVEILAHELVHVSQHYLGCRGGSVQWLREGFAEWGTAAVLDRLGFERREVWFAKAKGRVRWAFEGGDLPTLGQLTTRPEWAAVQAKPGGAASYELAMLATDFLIGRAGVAAVNRYFENSRVLDPRENFAQAFGLALAEFEAEFASHLEEFLR